MCIKRFLSSPSRTLSAPLGAATVALFLGLASCGSSGGSDEDQFEPQGTNVDSLITGITLDGATGTVSLETGNAPAGAPAGAVLTFAGGNTVAQGSTAQSTLSSTDAIDAVIVRLGGVNGFYQVALDQPGTTIDLLLSLAPSAPAGTVDCIFQGRRSGETDFGEAVTIPVEILNVGSGELQINLTWNTDADLDLHVFEPDGTEIYYGNPTSASGGELDLDANVGCGNVGVENVFWNQLPPVGTYRVAVDNYSQCSQTSSEFVVTITLPGQSPTIVSGSIAESDGLVDVATFDL